MEASGGGASVGTGDRSGGNNVGPEWSIEVDKNEESSDLIVNENEQEQLDPFEKASKVLVDKTGPPANAKPKIRGGLPYGLDDNVKLIKYFRPKMFVFGPYSGLFDSHLEGLYKMAEQIKVNLAAEFLQQNGVKKEYLFEEIKKQIKELKECYDDDYHCLLYLDDTTLTWIFMVDGCAILQFMYIFVDFRVDREFRFRNLGIKFDYIELLVHDLFLLKHQLPFQLLQLIIRRAKRIKLHTKEDEFCSTSKEDELLESIYKFIFYRFRTPEEWNENKDEILEDLKHDHVHLLDLLRKKLFQLPHQRDEKRDLKEIIIGWTVSLFDKLKCNRKEFERDWVPFCNVGKLREVGINLKRGKMGEISFNGGTLKLPPIILVESTAATFWNMLAYEMCPNFHNESEVSTYTYIMNKLIIQTQDLEELRERNILLTELGSDKEVVELFNDISTYLSPDLKRYDEVKRNIENYFDNKGLIWLHKISHDIHQYFKGRWSLLAFIGALLAVVSSIFQTVITFLAYQADSKKGN